MKNLITAVLIFLVLTVITGLVYPLVVTGIAQAVFPHQANGSLIVQNGKPVGSELIGQPFAGPRYFWSRPSATTPPYNAASSTGSNLGPTNPDLTKAVIDRIAALRQADPSLTGPIPADLVTASGSGLDPDISPEAAAFQVGRIARARGVDAGKVRELVARSTAGRTLGLLGEPRVNVLKLNMALDRVVPANRPAGGS